MVPLDFGERFQKEAQEYKDRERRERLEEQARRDQEAGRAYEEQLRFAANADTAHALLRPILEELIRAARFKLRCKDPTTTFADSGRYFYRVESTKTLTRRPAHNLDAFGLFESVETLRVLDVWFGHRDGSLVRMEPRVGSPKVFAQDALLDKDELKEEFSRVLIDTGKTYVLDQHLD